MTLEKKGHGVTCLDKEIALFLDFESYGVLTFILGIFNLTMKNNSFEFQINIKFRH